MISLLPLALLQLTLPLLAAADANEVFADVIGGRPDRGVFRSSLQMKVDEGVAFDSYHLRKRQFSLDANATLTKTSDKKWKVFAKAERDELETEARFANGTFLPNKLWSVSGGLSYTRLLETDKTVAGSFQIGSSSDRPFASVREVTVQANLAYKVPLENEAAWLFLLSVSNERGFAPFIPLPGVAYYFRAHENLRLALGLPFFLAFWTPIEKSVISFSYFPLHNAQVKASYFLFGPAHFYAQARFQSRNHFIFGRTDKKERLFQDELQTSLGFVMPLERHLLAEASLGYAFDRTIYLSQKSRHQRANGNVLRPDKALSGQLKLTAIF